MALGNIQVKRIGQKRLAKFKPKTKRSNQSAPSNRRNESTQNSTGFYLSQINHLEGTIAKYQNKCKTLTDSVTQLECQYNSLLSEKKDIVAYLKNELESKDRQIAELSEQLNCLTSHNEHLVKANERSQFELNEKFENREHDFNEQVTALSSRLFALDKYLNEKEEYERKMSDLQSYHEAMVNLNRNQLYDLERLRLLDRENLKAEFANRLNHSSISELLDAHRSRNNEISNLGLAYENRALKTKLKHLMSLADKLIEKNDLLKRKELENENDLQTLEKLIKHLNVENKSKDQMGLDMICRVETLENTIVEHNEKLTIAKTKLIEPKTIDETKHQNTNISANVDDLTRLLDWFHAKIALIVASGNRQTSAKSVNTSIEQLIKDICQAFNHLSQIETLKPKYCANGHKNKIIVPCINSNSQYKVLYKNSSTQTSVLDTKYFKTLLNT